MYTVVSGIAQAYDRTVGLRELVNPGQQKVRDLLKDNSIVVLTLTNEYLQGQHTVNLHEVSDLVYSADPSLTVDGWLNHIGPASLPTTPTVFEIRYGRAKYMDAHYAGYNTSPSTGWSGSDDPSTPEEDRFDIRLDHPTNDLTHFHKHMLATVGGYFHMVDSDPTAAYVRQGLVTSRISQTPRVGLLCLAGVGEVTTIPISQCTVTPRQGVELRRGLVITTSVSLSNKTVWASVGGQLLYLNNYLKVLGDRSVSIDWPKLNIHFKYLVAKRYIDLSTVDAVLGIDETSPHGVNLEDLNSDLGVRTYLNLPQSFLIVIDNPNVTTYSERLEDSGRAGKYFVNNDPHRLLLTSDGRTPVPWLIDEGKTWSISLGIDASSERNWYSKKMRQDNLVFYPGATMSDRRNRAVSTYLLDIRAGSLVQVSQ